MRRIIKIIVVLFIVNVGFSQQVLRKFVFDEVQEVIIPFTNIYIKGGNKGWVSDANGYFEINTKDIKSTDVLVFSAIGYQTQETVFFEIKERLYISMQPKTFTLNEVKIKTRRYKKGRLGKRRKSKSNQWHVGLRNSKNSIISREDAIFIPNHIGAEGIINDIRFFVRKGSNTPIKIQLYTNNVIAGLPSKPMLKEPMLVKENEDRKWLIISLKNENLSIPKSGFYVSVSWDVDSIYFAPSDTLIRTLNYTEPPKKRTDTLISKGLVLGETYLKSKNRYARSNSEKWLQLYNYKEEVNKNSENIVGKNHRYQSLAIYATVLYEKATIQVQEDVFDNNGIVPEKRVKKTLKNRFKKVKKDVVKYPQKDIISLLKSFRLAEKNDFNYLIHHLCFYTYDELEDLASLNKEKLGKSNFLDEIINNPTKIKLTEIEEGLYSFVFDNRIYSTLILNKTEWKISPTFEIREKMKF